MNTPSKRISILLFFIIGVGAGMVFTMLGLQTLFSYWGCVADLALAFGAVAAVTSLVLGVRRGGTLVIGTLVSLQLLFFAIAYSPLPRWLVDGWPRSDVATTGDAVYVFASGIGADGEMSEIALARLLGGLEILAAGETSNLILPELAAPTPSYAQAAKRFMAKLKIKAPEMSTIGPVQNTYEEALQVAALARQRGWRKLVAVTSLLHSRRACAVLESTGLEVRCAPIPDARLDAAGLSNTHDRIVAFSTALHERLGYFAYHYRGWIR